MKLRQKRDRKKYCVTAIFRLFLNSNSSFMHIFYVYDATHTSRFYFLRYYLLKLKATNEVFVQCEVIYCRYIGMTVAHFPIIPRLV